MTFLTGHKFLASLAIAIVALSGLTHGTSAFAVCDEDLLGASDGGPPSASEVQLRRRYREFSQASHTERMSQLGRHLFTETLASKNAALMEQVAGLLAQLPVLEKKSHSDPGLAVVVDRVTDAVLAGTTFAGKGGLAEGWLVSDLLLFLAIVPSEKLSPWHRSFFATALTDLSGEQRADFAFLLQASFDRYNSKKNNLFEVFEELRRT